MADTIVMTLPDGQAVRVWKKDAHGIRGDVRKFGSVVLIRGDHEGVYDYVPWESAEAKTIRATGLFRHVT